MAPCLVLEPTSSLSKQQYTVTAEGFSAAKNALNEVNAHMRSSSRGEETNSRAAPHTHGRCLFAKKRSRARTCPGSTSAAWGHQAFDIVHGEHSSRDERTEVRGTVGGKTVVHAAVEMNGEAGDDRHRLLERHKTALHALAHLHQHTACKREGPVEPGVINHASIRLNV